MNNDLASLESLFHDIAATQRALAEQYAATGLPEGVDYIRGSVDAFEAAAKIVAERILRISVAVRSVAP
jgi:hypothetical protein